MDAKHQLSFRCNEVVQVGPSLFFFFLVLLLLPPLLLLLLLPVFLPFLCCFFPLLPHSYFFNYFHLLDNPSLCIY